MLTKNNIVPKNTKEVALPNKYSKKFQRKRKANVVPSCACGHPGYF